MLDEKGNGGVRRRRDDQNFGSRDPTLSNDDVNRPRVDQYSRCESLVK